MKRMFIILIIAAVCIAKGGAQTVNINIDDKTIALVETIYAAELEMEKSATKATDSILSAYKHALPALEAIYIAAELERKAKTNLKPFITKEENVYYRRAYHLIKAILDEVLVVANYMIKDPATALYWGSYLWEVTEDVKLLANMFESIVTEGRADMSFASIQFLELGDEIKKMLREIGVVYEGIKEVPCFASSASQQVVKSIDDLFNELGNIKYTKEQFNEDVKTLINRLEASLSEKVTGAINEKFGNAVSAYNDATGNMQSNLGDKIEMLIRLINEVDDVTKNPGAAFRNAIGQIVGPEMDVKRLFKMAQYDISAWLAERLDEADAEYTQVYQIVRGGDQVIVDYMPNDTPNAILSGSEWYRVPATSYCYPTPSSIVPEILANSRQHAGVSAYESIDMVTETLLLRPITSGGAITKMAYAFSIKVVRQNTEQVEYSKVYNSYNDDLDVFEAEMETKLNEIRSADSTGRYTYYIKKHQKTPYLKPSPSMMSGCSSVVLTATCTDGGEIENGETWYKCGTCKNANSQHSHTCSMYTKYADEDTKPLSDEIKAKLDEDTAKRNELDEQRIIITKEITMLTKRYGECSIEDRAAVREQINEKNAQKAKLDESISLLDKQIRADKEAYEQALEDDSTIHTDNIIRLPYIMCVLKVRYNFNWADDGHWEADNWYVRKAYPNLSDGSASNSEYVFRAHLTTRMKKQLFHRARININWSIEGRRSSSSVVDVINVDPSKSDEENAKTVADAIATAQSEVGDGCKITAEYVKVKNIEINDDGAKTYHLLWASDRLNVARDICTRLTNIYGKLIGYEKMMKYKFSLTSAVGKILSRYEMAALRECRSDINEICHGRWWEAAVQANGYERQHNPAGTDEE